MDFSNSHNSAEHCRLISLWPDRLIGVNVFGESRRKQIDEKLSEWIYE